jgi:hypothetical protein
MGQCAPITWAMPGQPCGYQQIIATCLVGNIGYCPLVPNTLGGTCPVTVIPDGEP